MKRLRFPLIAAILLLVLIMLLPSAGANTVYFSVINFSVNPFNHLHQPWAPNSRGVIMIPHFALTGELSGSDESGLLRSHWSPEERYFTLYTGGERLTFIHGQNIAFTASKTFTSAPIEYANEDGRLVFFVPLDVVCEVFGYESTTYDTKWGTMVRIHSRGAVYNDQLFVSNYGESHIKPQYDAYIESLSPDPSLPPPPSGPPPTPLDIYDVPVYLTFDGAVSEATGHILDFLETEGLPGLFFLPPESLSGHPDTARRIAARHQIGLLLDEPDGEALSEAARDGNELLRETVFIKTLFLRADNAPAEDSGYSYRGYTHRFSPDDSAEHIVRVMTPLLKKTAEPSALVLSLPHSDAAADALAELLPLIGKDNIWRVSLGQPPVS